MRLTSLGDIAHISLQKKTNGGAGMNRVYQVVWNKSKGVWQAASELSRSGQGSSSGAASVSGSLKTISAGALLLIALPLHASNLPSGGTVVDGQGSINSSDKTLTVSQSSQNMAIDWQDFSIAEGHTVNFHQPNAQAAALNRVSGNNVSEIRGALNANGRVFLVNPNGVMFSPTARVDVGALVTSTLDISTEDFMAGNYHFEGASANAIVNQGNITTAEGGVVAMIAAEIINTGSITTPQGSTLMGAGNKVTLDLGGPVKIEVEEALLDTYIEQGGAIRADGGLVYLTAKSAGELASSVINHTGVTEARTLATGEDGRIMLMGDMKSGQVQVAGTLDASAPNGGNGGFIETSAANVSILDEVTVTTKADNGETGEWLIDPNDYTIAASDGDITGNALGGLLADNNITIQSVTGTSDAENLYATESGNGDIFVNDKVAWTSGNTLTLNAIRNIEINSTIDASGGAGGKLALEYGQGAANAGNTASYSINAPVNLRAGQNFSTKLGSDGTVIDYTVITDLGEEGSTTGTDLQGMNGNTSGYYALGSNIDASETSGWNNGAGWTPIGKSGSRFVGQFEGLGHTIDSLYINRDAISQGFFGEAQSAVIRNASLTNVDINGDDYTGGLVGINSLNSLVSNTFVSGAVRGNHNSSEKIGGLIGWNTSSSIITNSYAHANIAGNKQVGGLVGLNNEKGKISDSYSSGSVIGSSNTGGLLGQLSTEATVTNSYYDKDTNTGVMADSDDYGRTKAELMTIATDEWQGNWVTSINGSDYAGYAADVIDLPVQEALYAPSATLFEGGYGAASNPYTITNWNQLQNINYNTEVLKGGYYFTLSNNLGMSTTGYDGQASTSANNGAGWNPIGNSTNKFTGTFEGSGYTLDSFVINRSSEDYVGLFGYTNAATIQNLGITNASVSGHYYVGSIAGGLDGNLSNSYSSGSEVSGIAAVGGIAGSIFEGSINQVYSSDSVTGERNTGGLVGLSQSDKTSTISNSYSTSNVTVASATEASNRYIGGLVGINNQTITNSYASGAITGAVATNVGGLIGSGTGTVAHSYWDTETSGLDSSAGGEGKTTAEMQSLATFNDGSSGWSIEEVATLDASSPVLAWTLGRDSSVWVIGTKTPGATDGGGDGNTGGGDTGGGNAGGGDTGGGDTGDSNTSVENTDRANRASRVIAALQQSNARMASGSRPGADVGTNAFSSMLSQEDRQLSGGLELVEIDGARLAAQSSSRDQSGLLPVFVVDGGMQFNDTQNSDEQ